MQFMRSSWDCRTCNIVMCSGNAGWIQMVLYGLLLFSFIAMNVSQKLRRQTCQRVFKYILIGGLIFAISFSACENYLLRNAGYPPTFEPSQPAITVSYPNILNASVVEILQDKEYSCF